MVSKKDIATAISKNTNTSTLAKNVVAMDPRISSALAKDVVKKLAKPDVLEIIVDELSKHKERLTAKDIDLIVYKVGERISKKRSWFRAIWNGFTSIYTIALNTAIVAICALVVKETYFKNERTRHLRR